MNFPTVNDALIDRSPTGLDRVQNASLDMLRTILFTLSTLDNLTTEQFEHGEDRLARQLLTDAAKAAGIKLER